MSRYKTAFCVLFLLPFTAFSQERLIDTVTILDRHLNDASKTQLTYKISNNEFAKNSGNLAEILRFQTPLLIRENGAGLTASPGFRGTTAQQTAFVWNGININSAFLGQGDVNNLGLLGYDNLEIKSGGGSVLYGSGAIGGTVHLNNEIAYNRGWKNRIFAEGASFSRINSLLKTSYSDRSFSLNAAVTFGQSHNDYEVEEKHFKNLNGNYRKFGTDLGIGYKINAKNELLWQSQVYGGKQHYTVFEESAPKPEYKTYNFKSLLAWNFRNRVTTNQLAAAYLEEDFRYFGADDKVLTSGGTAKTAIVKNDFSRWLSSAFRINILAEFRDTWAQGTNSGIKDPQQKSFTGTALLKYQPGQKFYAEVGVKKQWISDFSTPFLYSAGFYYKAADFYTLKLNASKNFRIPTFNDLYWQPGGNPLLKPETAYQAEFGNDIRIKNFSFTATPYIIFIENMIQWIPQGALWSPQNVGKVRSAGLETKFDYTKAFGKHQLKFSGGYIFTDSQNRETQKQLVYIPKHKLFSTLDYTLSNFNLYFQTLYTGKVFTTADNAENHALQSYFLLNSGIGYTFFDRLTLGFKANNLTGKVYETVSYYPMPKRNFALNLNYNF